MAALSNHELPSLGAQWVLSVRRAFGFRDQLQDVMSLIHSEPV